MLEMCGCVECVVCVEPKVGIKKNFKHPAHFTGIQAPVQNYGP